MSFRLGYNVKCYNIIIYDENLHNLYYILCGKYKQQGSGLQF